MDKTTYSQHNLVKLLCKNMKFMGFGKLWYEDYNDTFLYKTYHTFIFFLLYTMTFMEILEIILKGHPADLHSDATAYGMAHLIVVIRMNIILYNREKVITFSKDLIKVLEGQQDKADAEKQYKTIKYSVIVQWITIVMTMVGYVSEGIGRSHRNGTPFIVVVSYYPKYEDVSFVASAIRIIMLLIQFILLLTMVSCDSFIFSQLVFLTYKFIALRKYFENLRYQIEDNLKVMEKDELTKWFKDSCLSGFRMHHELYRLADVINTIFGIMISIEVCQCSAVAIIILLRTTLSSDLSFAGILMTTMFTTAIIIQMTLFTWNMGEITYHASTLPTAIFHCGWDMCPSTELRPVLAMGLLFSQKPIEYKIFGVVELSHKTIIGVMRITYSLFTLLR